MRSSKSRSRNKQNRQRSLGNIINRVFDSSGPEGKVRGTPQQIIDKYLMLARDAQLSNDRVVEQAFLQHAEHYTRLLGEAQRELAREQEMRQGQQGQGGQNSNGNGNGHGHGQGQGGERSDNRDRYDQRPSRDEEGEQPDFAPLGAVGGDDDGSSLVETPEMYHAPEPVAFEGHMPDFLGGAAPRPQEDRPRRDRRERSDRGERQDRAATPDGQPPQVDKADKAERRDRGPRGPRRAKAPRAEGDAAPAVEQPAAPAASQDD